MTIDSITESEMKFGPFPEGHLYNIEKSEVYQEIKEGIKIADFLLIFPSRPMTVWIVEAKSSSPRSETQPDFEKFIAEIREKLTNTLALFVAICLKRHSKWTELPNPFQMLDLEKTNFRLILVIKKCEKQWLPPLQSNGYHHYRRHSKKNLSLQ